MRTLDSTSADRPRILRIVGHPACIAALVSCAIAAAPAVAASIVDVARNARAVDGKSAIRYTRSTTLRKNQLVATNGSGLLPNNIIAKAPDSDTVDGVHASQLVQEADTAAVIVHDTTVAGEQSIPDSAWTAVTFDSESLDTDGAHSTTTNSSRLTAPVAGTYVVSGYLHWGGTSNGERLAGIRLNGSTILSRQRVAQDAANEQHLSVSTLVRLSAGDYVELVAYQDAGMGGTPVVVGSTSETNFGMTWTGPGA